MHLTQPSREEHRAMSEKNKKCEIANADLVCLMATMKEHYDAADAFATAADAEPEKAPDKADQDTSFYSSSSDQKWASPTLGKAQGRVQASRGKAPMQGSS